MKEYVTQGDQKSVGTLVKGHNLKETNSVDHPKFKETYVYPTTKKKSVFFSNLFKIALRRYSCLGKLFRHEGRVGRLSQGSSTLNFYKYEA